MITARVGPSTVCALFSFLLSLLLFFLSLHIHVKRFPRETRSTPSLGDKFARENKADGLTKLRALCLLDVLITGRSFFAADG